MFTSIILVTYNQLEMATIPCVDSVIENTPDGDYEVIIIDNNSSDGTQEYLKSINNKNVRIQLNSDNKGYAGGNNDGMKIAKGDFIVLLNNDTLVSENWLKELTSFSQKNPSVGLLGPLSNNTGTEQKITIPELNETNYIEKFKPFKLESSGDFFYTNRLTFFCVAFTKKIIDEVGLLDENFSTGMFEDDDYCYRVKKAGYKLAVIEDSFVYHKGSLSFSKISSKKYKNLFERNLKYFNEKHNQNWSFSSVARAYQNKISSDKDKSALCSEKVNKYTNRINIRLNDYNDLLKHIDSVEREQNLPIIIKFFKAVYPFSFLWRLASNLRRNGVKKILKDFFFFKLNKKNPYFYLNQIKKINLAVLDQDYQAENKNSFSVITTIKNEEDGITQFLKSIEEQSLKPFEIIIIDGGSTDSTIEKIKDFKQTSALNIIFEVHDNVNIAAGRNIGRKLVGQEQILFLDAGTLFEKNFFANMVMPFYKENEVDLVSGVTVPRSNTSPGWILDSYQNYDFTNFLPSARHLAVKTELFDLVRGFPEFLSLTGEDTLFANDYRRLSKKWVINKKSVVTWDAPEDEVSGNKLRKSYGVGDGESGFGDFLAYNIIHSKSLNLSKLKNKKDAYFQGYCEGRKKRASIEFEKRKLKGIKVLISNQMLGESFSDKQKVTAHIENGYKVIFISKNKWSNKFNDKIFLDFDLSLIELYYIADFEPEDLRRRYKNYLSLLDIQYLHTPDRVDLELKEALK